MVCAFFYSYCVTYRLGLTMVARWRKARLNVSSCCASKDLVESVVVLALIELGIALKVLLWGFGYTRNNSNYDRAELEPRADSVPSIFSRNVERSYPRMRRS